MLPRFVVWVLTFFWIIGMSAAFAQDFAEGQVWSYKSRPAEEGSVLLINKIEVDPKFGQIFHISVLEVRVKNKRSPSVMTSELPHFPVSGKRLNPVVLRCCELQNQIPNTWKDTANGVANS